jgi:NADPH:quinone reductase-like Zn-dependent oxidoreductase
VLRVAEVPAPEPGPDEVRIKVEAAAINPVDLATRGGAFGARLPTGRHVLGWDAAGAIDALGSSVTDFAIGDRVAALSLWFREYHGAYAEQVVVPAEAVARVPDGLSSVEAATLPLNGLTALQALELTGLPAGQTIAVTGAAGAVGAYAVQLAARRGLRVVAVAGAHDEQLVRDLGAFALVPRSDDPSAGIHAVVPDGVDGLLDTANIGAPMLRAVHNGGIFLAVTGPAVPEPERQIDVRLVLVRADAAQLAELLRLAADGQLTPRVAATYPFEEAAQAHARLEEGGVRGRLVLVPSL